MGDRRIPLAVERQRHLRARSDAVRDLCRAFKAGLLPDSLTDERYFNVKTLKQAVLV